MMIIIIIIVIPYGCEMEFHYNSYRPTLPLPLHLT